MTNPSPPIRVVVQQPALPKYRLPIFAELARRPGLKTTIVYGEMPGLPNVAPAGFDAEFRPLRLFNVLGRQAMWHSPQFEYATRRKTDVLILSWNLHYLTLVPALLRARAGGVKTILWGHGYSRDEAATRSFLRNKVGRLADALLFYGKRTAEQFLAAGWPPEQVFVAPNALDQTAIAAARTSWQARPADLTSFRTEKGIGPGPVLLFVSRLLPENRIDLLLDAAAMLRPRHPALRVVLVGGGDQGALRAQAARLGIADAVVFAGPVYEEEQIAPYFLSANVFVYPAKLGLSIMHCFGYGLPIVTAASIETQFPEREALAEGTNGLTFKDGDAADLSRAIERLLTDPAERSRMAAAALATVQGEYSVASMVDGFERAIRAVMQRR